MNTHKSIENATSKSIELKAFGILEVLLKVESINVSFRNKRKAAWKFKY